MTGLAGSTIVGARVTIGANSGFAGHLTVGDGAIIAGRAGVTKPVAAGAVVSGFPAVPHREAQRVLASTRLLPDALKRLRVLERQVADLENALQAAAKDTR
jgi:UDP-3-O-[3-hydroxymyristoyl] glucosamine N-acyltransferase